MLTAIMLVGLVIRSSGACVAPCTARFEVVDQAEPESYQWSGCATGTGPRATCHVADLGSVVTATVVATDEAGGRSSRSATISARATDMDMVGKHLLANGYYSTPNGSTSFIGYVHLRPDYTAWVQFMVGAAGNTAPTSRYHNAMRLVPGYVPPLYDPNCVPGPVNASTYGSLVREATWDVVGGFLKVAIPYVEGSTFSFEWAPEVGSQAASLVLRRVINLDNGGWAGDPYGYAFLTGPPRARTIGDFMPYYAAAQSTHVPGQWLTIAPEYNDYYPATGFFDEAPVFFAPPLGLGYYSDAPSSGVWSLTILVNYSDPPPGHSSMYGMHSFLFDYSDDERPSPPGTMYWHGGHDFSENGCFGDDQGHVLTILGDSRAMVWMETGIGGVYHLGRAHAVEYPRSDDPIFNDGFE